MSKPAQTTAELRRAGIVTGSEIAQAGHLYQSEPTGTYRFASGHSLDLGAAVASYGPARCTVANPSATATTRRVIVSNAIMLACPTAPRV